MKNKEIVSWQDQKASERFAMISPLLADDLDPAKRSQLRSRIAETSSVAAYQKGHCTGSKLRGAGKAFPACGP